MLRKPLSGAALCLCLPTAFAAAQDELVVGIIRDDNRPLPARFESGLRASSPLKEIVPLENKAQALERGADVILECGSDWYVRSAYSHRLLGKGRGCRSRTVGTAVYELIRPGTSAYNDVIAERNARRGQRQAESQVDRNQAAVVSAAPKSRPPAAPNFRAPEDPSKVAVVIGIEKYADLPAADFAERDAEAMREHLRALGVAERNLFSLIGTRATRTSLVKALEGWLQNVVKADSEVFIYFSGHGAPNVKTGEGYLLPWDGDPQFIEETGYPISRLYAKLGELPAKRVVVALDSCFSGAGGRSVLPKGTRPLVTQVRTGTVPPNVIALTASAPNQISGTIAEQGHGAFTYYLLKGLNGEAAD